jgi:Uma2 family endonuclease
MSEPAWDIAKLFPPQGAWDEDEYLEFARKHPRVEFDDGVIEVLPMPTFSHQNIILLLLDLLRDLAKKRGGHVSFAGMPIKLPGNKYRQPDLLYASRDHAHLVGEQHWTGADLVMEVVSPSAEDREHDYVRKRHDYARGEVAEYWIVDPGAKTIVVLTLRDGRYSEHGVFAAGERVVSPTFGDLSLDVGAVFNAT